MNDPFQDHTIPKTNKSPEAGSGDKKYMLSGVCVNAQNTRTHNLAERFGDISVKNTEHRVKNAEKIAKKPAAINFAFPPNPDPRPSLSPVIEVNLTPPAVNSSTGAAAESSDVRRQTWKYIPACHPTENKEKKATRDFTAGEGPGSPEQPPEDVADALLRGDLDELSSLLSDAGLRVLPEIDPAELDGMTKKRALSTKMSRALSPYFGGSAWSRFSDEEQEHFAKIAARIHFCGSAANSLLLRWTKAHKTRTFGNKFCRSPLCLICAEKKRNTLLHETSGVNAIWLRQNQTDDGEMGAKTFGKPWAEINFLTLTIRRDLGLGLSGSSECMRLLTASIKYYNKYLASEVSDRLGIIGYLRRIEATAGMTGMHYHVHALLYRYYKAGGGSDLGPYEMSVIIWKAWNKAVAAAAMRQPGLKKLKEIIRNHKGDGDPIIVERPRAQYKNGKFDRLKGGVVLEKCNKYSGDEIAAYLLKTEKEREEFKNNIHVRKAVKNANEKAQKNTLNKYTLEVVSTVTKRNKSIFSDMSYEDLKEKRFSVFDLPLLLDHENNRVRAFAYEAIRSYALDLSGTTEIQWSFIIPDKQRMGFKKYVLEIMGGGSPDVDGDGDDLGYTEYSRMTRNRFSTVTDYSILDLEEHAEAEKKRGSFVKSPTIDEDQASKIIKKQKEIYAEKLRIGKVLKQKNLENDYNDKLGAHIHQWLLSTDHKIDLTYKGIRGKKKLDYELIRMLKSDEELRTEFVEYSKHKNNRKIKTYFHESFLTQKELSDRKEEIKEEEASLQEEAENEMDQVLADEKETEELVRDQYELEQCPDWPEFRKIIKMENYDTDSIILELHKLGYTERDFMLADGSETKMWKDWDRMTTRYSYQSEKNPFKKLKAKMAKNTLLVGET